MLSFWKHTVPKGCCTWCSNSECINECFKMVLPARFSEPEINWSSQIWPERDSTLSSSNVREFISYWKHTWLLWNPKQLYVSNNQFTRYDFFLSENIWMNFKMIQTFQRTEWFNFLIYWLVYDQKCHLLNVCVYIFQYGRFGHMLWSG